MSVNRIKVALYLDSWDFESGDQAFLSRNARRISAEEFDISMKTKIFCPICFTPLSRNPLTKAISKNKRKAFFQHLGSYKKVECRLRVPKPEGKLYSTEEEASKAIENEQLAIIHGFKQNAPESHDTQAEDYDQTAIEDDDGPISEIPISRHKGKTLKLPTKITTIVGICRNFKSNFYKYFYMPEATSAIPLKDLLHNIKDIKDVDDVPKLYFGVIKNSYALGEKEDTNYRMTELQFTRTSEYKDFHLKDLNGNQKKHGIDDCSKRRIVVFWGKITLNGIGLCVEKLAWGEYGLLPEKYNSILLK